jgi:ubiquitin carboxyl-terminal hydrolase 7
LLKLVKLQPGGSGRIRIFDIHHNGRSQKELTSSEMIGNLPEPAELYAEEIPVEELNIGERDKIIDVFHYSKDPSRYFGVPFKFVIKEVSCVKRCETILTIYRESGS